MTIKGKLGGQINKEELPLSAEGQVDELIRMAVSPSRLVRMYIGKLSPLLPRPGTPFFIIQQILISPGWAPFM